MTTQTPFITNCLVAVVHTKPVNSNFSPIATTLWHSISAMSSSDSLTPKPTSRIKLHVASYHTTKVIAHKASYSNLRPKIASQGNVPQHSHRGPHGTAQCPYTLQWDALFPLKIAPSHEGSGSPSNTLFLSANSISIVAAVLAGLTSVTDRPTSQPTDHATRLITVGHICVRSTAMRRTNTTCILGIFLNSEMLPMLIPLLLLLWQVWCNNKCQITSRQVLCIY